MVPKGTVECRKAYTPLRREYDCGSHGKWFSGNLFCCLGGYDAGLGTRPCHEVYECPGLGKPRLVLWSQDLTVLLSVGDRIMKSCWCGEVYS